jgi:gliding motility-associated-like protein
LNAGLVAALTALNIYYASDQVDAPVVGSSNVTVCSGTTATLTAKTSINAAVEWFSAPTGGVALAAGDTLHTPVLTQTTTFYAEALRVPDSCANLNRVPVTVSVLAPPAVPIVVHNPDTICSGGNAVLQASAGANQVLWFDSASGGNLLYTGNIYTTPALTAGKAYFAASSNGTCSSSSRDSVSVIVGQVPAVPVVHPSDTSVCQGSPVTLTVTQPQAGVVYNWYTVLSGGTPVFTGTSYITPPLAASVTYYVEAVNTASNCTAASARTQVTVSVTPVPAPPSVTASQVTVCSGQPATVSVAGPQTGLTYQWYDAATGGNLLFTGPIYSLSAVTASQDVFVQAAASGGGCGSATRTEVSITADSIPAVPQVQATDVSVCAGGTATFTVSSTQTGVTYNWYDAPTAGNLLASGTSFTTPSLNASATYYVGAVNAPGCSASSRTTVNADVVAAPLTPTVALSPVVICAGGMATLQVVNPQNGIVYDWYASATGSTVLAQGASFSTPVLSSGTTYYVAAMNATPGCSSGSARTGDSVAIGTQPAVPVLASADNQVCAGSNVTLTVQSPQAGINYNWYASAASATPLFVGAQYTLTGDTASGVYYVQASTSGGCTSATEATANVTVNPVPANPTVQVPDITVCPNNTATFTINTPQPGYTYNWYAAASGGTALASGTSFTTGALTTGATYYVAAQNAGTCSSPGRTIVTAAVTNNLTPPQLVNSTVSACSGQPAVLTVSNPQGGITYNWYDASSGGNLVNQGNSYTLTSPTRSDTVYVASVASGGSCTSATRTQAIVTVTVLPPSPSLVTSGAQVCSGGNVALQIMNPQSGTTYNWYTDASGGTPVFSGTIYNLSDVTASAEYYVEASLNGCGSAIRTPVTVDISAPASTPTVTASSPAVCPGSDAVLTAASATSGATFSWYATATGGTPIAGGPSFTTGALTSDTTFYVGASSPQGCTGTSLTPVSVTQLLPLDPPTVSVESRTATSITFQWTPVSGAVAYQVSLDSGTTFVTPTSGPTGLTETINGLLPNQTASIEVRALGASPCQTSTAAGSGAGISGNPLGDNIFVPNIFSPNGDGVNDILYVYSNAIASMVFRVYNQWGQELFESRAVSTGWDGTAGGAKQPIGVYIYVLQATMQDGTIINKKGSVTLIR